MPLQHNHTVSPKEPNWSDVDKLKLSRNSHADMGSVEDSTTWHWPHHFIQNGRTGDAGIYIDGTLYLHRGGLETVLAETQHMDDDIPVRKHLLRHAKAIDMKTETKKSASASLHQMHGKTEKAEPASHSMLTDFSLRGIAESTQKVQDNESLSALADEILLSLSTKEQGEKTWMGKEQVQSLSRQAQQLIALRRRQIISMPTKQDMDDYELGRKLGSKI